MEYKICQCLVIFVICIKYGRISKYKSIVFLLLLNLWQGYVIYVINLLAYNLQ